MMFIRSAGAVAVAVATTCVASADTRVFELHDHPDGNANPPPYGLRLDGVFGAYGQSGTTSFSFDTAAGVFLTVTDNGGDIEINIAGTVYGGRDTGGGYGFGAGAYALDFTYAYEVEEDGAGWRVSPQNVNNRGALTAGAGITGIAEGTEFGFFEMANTGNPFRFVQDDHRLQSPSDDAIIALDPWVGRGWLQLDSGYGGTHDWLFYGVEVTNEIPTVPLPTTAGLGLAGLGLVGSRRRRR